MPILQSRTGSIGLLVLLLAAPLGWAESLNTLSIGTSEFAPFQYQIDSGGVVGSDTEIVAAVVRNMGFEPRFELKPWARVEAEVTSGHMDVIYSLTASPERKERYWLTAPLSSVSDVFFKRSADSIAWNTLDDLEHYRVGISAEYSYVAGFMAWLDKKQGKIIPTAHNTPELINLRKLAHSRIDLFICELAVCSHILQTQGQKMPALKGIDFIPKPVGPIRGFRAGFSKARPDARQLRDRFNEALARMVARGERKAILARYGITQEPTADRILSEDIP